MLNKMKRAAVEAALRFEFTRFSGSFRYLLLAEAPTLMWSFTFMPLAFSFAMRTASLRSFAELAVPVSSMPLSVELTLMPERFGLAWRAD